MVVDSGYDSPAADHLCKAWFGIEYEVVQREGKCFVVQPHRWVVERTFAWFGKYRRLSKDYEYLPSVSGSFLYVASIYIMVRRLARL
ncbi:MAG: transposase [Anaerolineae bacterium]|nr:transposase [Anaerolineae bacterium]MCO5194161.1 transposase [Anaerolineae bacterium]MCO5205414.1 transposase [Anaerolineae bacterium]